MTAQTEDIGHAGENADHISRADQSHTDFGGDGFLTRWPHSTQSQVTAKGDHPKANQEDRNLNKSDHPAAVKPKEAGTRP